MATWIHCKYSVNCDYCNRKNVVDIFASYRRTSATAVLSCIREFFFHFYFILFIVFFSMQFCSTYVNTHTKQYIGTYLLNRSPRLATSSLCSSSCCLLAKNNIFSCMIGVYSLYKTIRWRISIFSLQNYYSDNTQNRS